jgi:protoporphyrinogen oxidase
MNENYDLVIIGSGPSGLALAQCVSHLNKKILIIEKQDIIGGCHSVRRVNNLFSEHGPRIYSKTYKVFIELLKEMDLSFDELFTEYRFSIAEIGGETVFSTLSYLEIFKLGIEFIKLLVYNDSGKNVILKDFLINNKFTEESYEIIDRICKLTDGGGADKYTLNQFLQLLNQQFFYKLYQPRLPNDKGLFKLWRNYLESKNVKFSLNTNLKQIYTENNIIKYIKIQNEFNQEKNVIADKFVFAIPPLSLLKVINNFNLEHNWGNLEKFAKETAYIDYISMTFHWNKKLDLKKVYGFPKTPWGIAFVVLTDYMKFEEDDSKTVISTAITIKDKKSKNNNKTADECNESELINEIFIQLKESFGNIPFPTNVVISPGVIRDKNNKEWKSEDTAFIMTANKGFLSFQNDKIKNMYNLGTHNGKSLYRFTSLEAAVSNSIIISKILFPELKKDEYIKLKRTTSVSDVFKYFILIIIIYLLYNNGRRK